MVQRDQIKSPGYSICHGEFYPVERQLRFLSAGDVNRIDPYDCRLFTFIG